MRLDDEHITSLSRFDGDTTVSDSDTQTNESVLRDILEELDRERHRRAELEVQVKKLTEELGALRSSTRDDKEQGQLTRPEQGNENVTLRTYLAMETQVNEYQAILDELTRGKPAIALAAASSRTTHSSIRQNSANNDTKTATLPLNVVRLLETLPWTAHAQEHVFAREELFEWQLYDSREQKWISSVRAFPPFFKQLHVIRTQKDNQRISYESSKERGFVLSLASGSGSNSPLSPSHQGVLTDVRMAHLLSISDNGYPLPDDGGVWEWIGEWQIDQHLSLPPALESLDYEVDSDEQGWLYTQEEECSKPNPTEWAWYISGGRYTQGKKACFERKLRRRKWIRQRVLVDYPCASVGTKEYLKLLAENARLVVAINNISDQLVEVKISLTEKEEILVREQSQFSIEIQMLRAELAENYELMRQAGIDMQQRCLTTRTGLSTKLSLWVKTGRVGDVHSSNSSPESTDCSTLPSSSPSDESEGYGSSPDSKTPNRRGGFDWKRVGRGALLEKLTRQSLQNSDQGKAQKSSRLMEKFSEAAQLEAAEGTSTDESIEDLEMQEAS